MPGMSKDFKARSRVLLPIDTARVSMVSIFFEINGTNIIHQGKQKQFSSAEAMGVRVTRATTKMQREHSAVFFFIESVLSRSFIFFFSM